MMGSWCPDKVPDLLGGIHRILRGVPRISNRAQSLQVPNRFLKISEVVTGVASLKIREYLGDSRIA